MRSEEGAPRGGGLGSRAWCVDVHVDARRWRERASALWLCSFYVQSTFQEAPAAAVCAPLLAAQAELKQIARSAVYMEICITHALTTSNPRAAQTAL